MSRIETQTLTVAGVAELLALAAEEGWNPGLDDAAAFHAVDPEGFLARRVDGRFAAGISVVRQDATHGFLGLYIAAPALRGRGHGLALWNEALVRSRARGIERVGLDGVVERQADYRASGFEPLHRNLRFAGRPVRTAPAPPGVTVRPVTPGDLRALTDLDAAVGGVRRARFCDVWLTDLPGSRTTLVAVSDADGPEGGGSPCGFGTVRRCLEDWKIGPLVADDAGVAAALMAALIDTAHADRVVLDVPEPNRAAVDLAVAAGLAPTFETSRMHLGPVPPLDVAKLYGAATFELG